MKVIFLICASLQSVFAVCGTCGTTSSVACISETQYFPCVGSAVNPTTIFTCASGTFCADVAGGCAAAVTPACEVCNVCNSLFACTSSTEIVICSGGVPSATTFSCPAGTFCDIFGDPTTFSFCKANTDGRMILCGVGTDSSVTTTNPSETTTTMVSSVAPEDTTTTVTTTLAQTEAAATTTSTTSTTPSPTTTCQSQAAGIIADPYGTSCKSYIRCITQANGTVIGNVYRCPGNTTFDANSQRCSITSSCV